MPPFFLGRGGGEWHGNFFSISSSALLLDVMGEREKRGGIGESEYREDRKDREQNFHFPPSWNEGGEERRRRRERLS